MEDLSRQRRRNSRERVDLEVDFWRCYQRRSHSGVAQRQGPLGERCLGSKPLSFIFAQDSKLERWEGVANRSEMLCE